MAKTNTDQKNRKKARKSTGKDYKRTNLELAALKLLYHEPLFETVNKGQRDINVLVVGWNDVSKAFVDQCLSVGQMMGHYINIVVMTASPDPGGDMGGYLGERPALADFINIYILQKEKKTPLKNDDPCQDNAGEMYGDLYIMTYPEGADANTLLSSFPDKSREFNYIVLARKDDVNNKEIADSLVSELDNRKKKDCKVCYVVYDKDSVRRNGKAVPVYVPQNPFTDRIDRELVDKDLDRMAFNSHILWGSFVNRDYQEARRKFRPPKKRQ